MQRTRWPLLAALFLSAPALAAYQLNLPTPESAVARQIYDLHTLSLWVCLGIFVVVFGAMFYSIFNHRKSQGHAASHFHESTGMEILWTLIPFLILLGMAWPATKLIIAQKDTSNPDLTIKATGYQWKWGYEYLGEDVKFMSVISTPPEQIANTAPKGEHYLLEVDEPVVVPVGKKVRILTTSADVIHAWWVPALGSKVDAIPGFIRDTWFVAEKEGTYRGVCTELCGKSHAYMPIVVIAKNEADYAAWLADKKQKQAAAANDSARVFTLDELKTKGKAVYADNCASCHGANGEGLPGVFPALDKSKVATGDKSAHIALTINGVKDTAMPAFGKQLSAADLAAVLTFERNSWSNKTGDMVQPAEIAAKLK